ncbi:hypothetical protein MUK42_25398 [Musa troglodytarum]|uniref:Nucleotide exchange factor Fes1 domain-containing protein n=1 Tax=Musa troglodytarum TaxID=320322 RepID=A0A9E7KND0_9LILI|nr:hypothetical protein MUK42_25398 [Musa troglodytarum]
MAGNGLKWDGLLKWSLSHADGTRPARILSEEDRKWLVEAMQAPTSDVGKRMKEITLVMRITEDVPELQGIESADIVEMLDELGEHVESIDMTNERIKNPVSIAFNPLLTVIITVEKESLTVEHGEGEDDGDGGAFKLR